MSADSEVKGSFGGAYWDDLRTPAIAINPPGAASDPDRDPGSGWLWFDKAATELIYVDCQLPHGWVEGSQMGFHVHWHKKTAGAGTVAWRMRYRYANIGAVWSAWTAAETVTTPVVSDGNLAEQNALTAFTAILIPSGRISMGMKFELARVGASDTYDDDAVLTDVDLHILKNQPGSVQLYKKYRDELLDYA